MNRLGAGQTTCTEEKIQGEEDEKQERQTRKRAREESIDTTMCIMKIQKVIDQCLIELDKLLNSKKKRPPNSSVELTDA